MSDTQFIELLTSEGLRLYRDMPWRRDTRGYYVLVSELMLQQTQVERVMPKFEQFITRFPDFISLADASLADVLVEWNGLGYNRRAKYLHDAARMVVQDYESKLPVVQEDLVKLPGVGKNTAGALGAYVYNRPTLFVETNVRTVYLHHFFADRNDVSDGVIIDKLAETLDRQNPRMFYWALMDYGAELKRRGVRNNAASKHYRKQSPLAGSVREVRGAIIRQLTQGSLKLEALVQVCDPGDGRFERAYEQLIREGLISQHDQQVSLTSA